MDNPTNHVDITLPDGSLRTFAQGVTGGEIAAAIGPGLAKHALAAKASTARCRIWTCDDHPQRQRGDRYAPHPRRWN